MNDIKKKGIILSVIVLLIGLMIVGGTYAYLSVSANITNTNYVGVSTCFLVDYDIDNGDNTETITGTLVPSLGPSSGLNGRVGLKVKDECEVNGVGTLKIHINNTTSSSLTQIATSHCEDKKTGDFLTEYSTEASCSSANQKWRNYPTSYCEDRNTLQFLKNYTTQTSCTSNNGNWVTNGSPLKYAIYNVNDTNGSPISVGHITSSTGDVTIYDDIILTHDQRYFYVYIWLDGNLTDNSHADLPFDGYISASAIQNDRLLPNEYEEVEWLGSTGTQYINTELYGTYNTSVEVTATITQDSGTGSRGYIQVFGILDSTSGITINASVNENTGYSRFGSQIASEGSLYTNFDVKHIYINNNQGLYLDGTKTYTWGQQGSFTSPLTMYLFKANNSSAIGPMRIYNCRIKENGVLLRHFVPCYRKSDSVRGMYDIIERKFYTNAGSGTFEIPT